MAAFDKNAGAGYHLPPSPSPIKRFVRAYSPVVIEGVVRLIDFALISMSGLAVYFGYVMRTTGFTLGLYAGRRSPYRVAAVISFQAADVYDIQMFRARMPQTDTHDLVMVLGLPAVHRRLVSRKVRRRRPRASG